MYFHIKYLKGKTICTTDAQGWTDLCNHNSSCIGICWDEGCVVDLQQVEEEAAKDEEYLPATRVCIQWRLDWLQGYGASHFMATLQDAAPSATPRRSCHVYQWGEASVSGHPQGPQAIYAPQNVSVSLLAWHWRWSQVCKTCPFQFNRDHGHTPL